MTTATARSADTKALADELHRARMQRAEVETITSRRPDFDIEAAYEVQDHGIALRVSEGESIIGGKLGFTSIAMQRAMGVSSPNYGWLTTGMLIHDHLVHLGDLIHPKVEPEIGFLLASDLPPDCTADDVLSATESLFPCLEVVDSRYRDFEFRPLDNIADNSSAGAVVVGESSIGVSDAELRLCGVVLRVNGEVVDTASGAAALDDPAAAVAWMAANTRGRGLEAGDLVISGGLTRPIDLAPGMVVEVAIDRIGEARLTVV